MRGQSLPLDVVARIDEICDAFEAAWQKGMSPNLEEFLFDVEGSERSSLLAGLLALELHYRRRRGEQPTAAEYEPRFPDHHEAIRDVFQGVQAASTTGADVTSQNTVTTGTFSPPTIPGYEVFDELGRGGMGVVLRVRDSDFNRTLAVKVMLPQALEDPGAEKRFLDEAKLTGQLQHPGIPPVHELGRLENGAPFFAMKLIQGRTLASILKTREGVAEHTDVDDGAFHAPYDLPRLITIFENICQTLAYAHNQGVIHRDLKPSNIMVGAFGEVQVMDWGLAKAVGGQWSVVSGSQTFELAASELSTAVTEDRIPNHGPKTTDHGPRTREGAVMGTPAYMAPEQARGEIDAVDVQSDVFGLGAILCEILTGEPPFQGPTARDMLLQAQDDNLNYAFAKLHACGADSELTELSAKCLSPNKETRPQHAGALAEAVAAYQQGVQEKLRRAELERAEERGKAEKERQRRRWAIAAAVAALLFVTTLAAATVWYVAVESARAAADVRRFDDISSALSSANRFHTEIVNDLKIEGGVHRLLNSPEVWEGKIIHAQEALERAKNLQAAGTRALPIGLQKQMDTLASEVKKDKDNYRLAMELEMVREKMSANIENKFDYKFALRKYPEILRRVGLDAEHGRPEEVAKRMREWLILDQIVAALVVWEWAYLAEKQQPTLRYVRIAHLATADRSDDSLRKPKDWNYQIFQERAAKLRADPGRFAKLSRAMMAWVGNLLPDGEGKTSWLHQAQYVYPDDFWLAFRLAYSLAEENNYVESCGMYKTALAIRPRSAIAWYNYGITLAKHKKLDDAVAAYKKAVEYDTQFACAWYNMGHALGRKKDFAAAVVAYKNALKIDDKIAPAWNNLGNALRAQKEFADAVNAFNRALKIDDKLIEAWSNLGLALADRGKLDEAIAAYKAALKIDKKYAIAWNNLGLVRHKQKKFEKAVAAYREAQKIDGEFTAAWTNLGDALADQEKLDEAVAAYRKALKIDDEDAKSWYNLGNVLIKQKKLDEAVAAFENAVSFNDQFAKAWHNLGFALAHRKKLGRAVSAYKKALKIDDKDALAWYNLGVSFAKQKKDSAAIAAFNNALEIDIRDAGSWTELGNSLRALQKANEAAAAYKRALAINDRDANCWTGLGHALRAQKKLTEAAAAYRSALRIDDKLAIAWTGLGNSLAAQKKLDEAIAAHKKAVTFDERGDVAWYNLGNALANAKKLDEAGAAYKQALEINEEYANAWINLGTVLSTQKNWSEAIAAFERAIKLNDRDAYTHLNLGTTLHRMAKYAEAARSFARVLELLPAMHPLRPRVVRWRQEALKLAN